MLALNGLLSYDQYLDSAIDGNVDPSRMKAARQVSFMVITLFAVFILLKLASVKSGVMECTEPTHLVHIGGCRWTFCSPWYRRRVSSYAARPFFGLRLVISSAVSRSLLHRWHSCRRRFTRFRCTVSVTRFRGGAQQCLVW